LEKIINYTIFKEPFGSKISLLSIHLITSNTSTNGKKSQTEMGCERGSKLLNVLFSEKMA
jgi:hypothetical protein